MRRYGLQSMRTSKIKQQTPKYRALHYQLRKKHGKAYMCSNPDCTHKNPKRFEWALRKGREYSDNPLDYIQMCCSCHRKYDISPAAIAKTKSSNKGKPVLYRERIVMQIGATDHWCYLGIHRASKASRVKQTSIGNCLSGRSKMAGGFIWRYRE